MIGGWPGEAMSGMPRTRYRNAAVAILASAIAAAPFAAGSRVFSQSAAAASHGDSGEVTFPLRTRTSQRYLEDAAGKPFLMHGDTAWSLIAQLTREDAEKYLEDRRQRGFNTILVNLLEHRFATKAPANIYGQPPFTVAGDFSTPNEAYFAHADQVLRMAAEKGFLVLLAPAYLGYDGGPEGWYKTMVANGLATLRVYGQYLGRRYRNLNNIMWAHAGDYNPPNKDLVRAVADGIRDFDTISLHTVHCAPETAAIEYWKGDPWLHVNNVYTYKPVYAPALRQHAQAARMPFFLLESAYENEHGATELRVRIQAYQALLAGAAGQVYGNNPIWHFDGPGLHPVPASWQESLNSRGAQSMAHLRALFAELPWWTLEPDTAGTFLVAGAGGGMERAVAAVAQDKSMAILYLPTLRKVRVDLGRLVGPKITARWYDPSSGTFATVNGSPFPKAASHILQPDTLNSAGLGDWILLLESGS